MSRPRKGRPKLIVRAASYVAILGVSAYLAKLTFTGLRSAGFDTESAGNLAVVITVISAALGVLIYYAWFIATEIKGARVDLITLALLLQPKAEKSPE